MKRSKIGLSIAGLCAGAVTGLFGAGGGMILVPLLGLQKILNDEEIFPASVAIILPICAISLLLGTDFRELPLKEALPYLLGSCAGGVLAGIWGKRIPTVWLHRFLGAMILWGGVRYLC